MKHLLLTTIAAVVLVGCGESQSPEPPDISIHSAAFEGNIEAVKQAIADGANVNAKSNRGVTPLDWTTTPDDPIDTAETADLLRKHGGKTGEELKAEGK